MLSQKLYSDVAVVSSAMSPAMSSPMTPSYSMSSMSVNPMNPMGSPQSAAAAAFGPPIPMGSMNNCMAGTAMAYGSSMGVGVGSVSYTHLTLPTNREV